MKILDQELCEKLIESALYSERLRTHFPLHDSHQSIVQRLIIALTFGSYIPPHYHELSHQWEYFQILRGRVSLIIFDDDSTVINIIELGEGTTNYAIEIPPLTIHTLICISDSAVLMESKEGPFNNEFAKVLPNWSPDETFQNISRAELMSTLHSLEIGTAFI